ncbi:Uncharacterized protein QTN25_004827 [Entamoeba marina]
MSTLKVNAINDSMISPVVVDKCVEKIDSLKDSVGEVLEKHVNSVDGNAEIESDEVTGSPKRDKGIQLLENEDLKIEMFDLQKPFELKESDVSGESAQESSESTLDPTTEDSNSNITLTENKSSNLKDKQSESKESSEQEIIKQSEYHTFDLFSTAVSSHSSNLLSNDIHFVNSSLEHFHNDSDTILSYYSNQIVFLQTQASQLAHTSKKLRVALESAKNTKSAKKVEYKMYKEQIQSASKSRDKSIAQSYKSLADAAQETMNNAAREITEIKEKLNTVDPMRKVINLKISVIEEKAKNIGKEQQYTIDTITEQIKEMQSELLQYNQTIENGTQILSEIKEADLLLSQIDEKISNTTNSSYISELTNAKHLIRSHRTDKVIELSKLYVTIMIPSTRASSRSVDFVERAEEDQSGMQAAISTEKTTMSGYVEKLRSNVTEKSIHEFENTLQVLESSIKRSQFALLRFRTNLIQNEQTTQETTMNAFSSHVEEFDGKCIAEINELHLQNKRDEEVERCRIIADTLKIFVHNAEKQLEKQSTTIGSIANKKVIHLKSQIKEIEGDAEQMKVDIESGNTVVQQKYFFKKEVDHYEAITHELQAIHIRKLQKNVDDLENALSLVGDRNGMVNRWVLQEMLSASQKTSTPIPKYKKHEEFVEKQVKMPIDKKNAEKTQKALESSQKQHKKTKASTHAKKVLAKKVKQTSPQVPSMLHGENSKK